MGLGDTRAKCTHENKTGADTEQILSTARCVPKCSSLQRHKKIKVAHRSFFLSSYSISHHIQDKMLTRAAGLVRSPEDLIHPLTEQGQSIHRTKKNFQEEPCMLERQESLKEINKNLS